MPNVIIYKMILQYIFIAKIIYPTFQYLISFMQFSNICKQSTQITKTEK